jgi:hypothetical protein
MTIGFRTQFRFANQLQCIFFSSKDSSIFLSIFMAVMLALAVRPTRSVAADEPGPALQPNPPEQTADLPGSRVTGTDLHTIAKISF